MQQNNNNNEYNIWYGCILIYLLWCGLGPIVIDWIMSTPNLYGEALIPNVPIFGNKAFMEIIILNEIIRVGT